jgi:hypothetical protein
MKSNVPKLSCHLSYAFRIRSRPSAHHTVSIHIPHPAFFRFENSWAQISVCGPLINNEWNTTHYHSNAASRLTAKLKRIIKSLKRWRQSLPTQKFRETNIKCVISFVDHLEETRNLAALELKLLIIILQRLMKEKVAFWRER